MINLDKDIAIVTGAGGLLPAAVRGVKLAAEEVRGAIFQGIRSVLLSVLQDISLVWHRTTYLVTPWWRVGG